MVSGCNFLSIKNKLKDNKNEVDELTKKIIQRMNELGRKDVMSYRHDKIIAESIHRICDIYAKAFDVCEHYDDSDEPFCRLFSDGPSILKRLELSEEILCPLKPT